MNMQVNATMAADTSADGREHSLALVDTDRRGTGFVIALMLAIAVPWQISYNMLPNPTFVNELFVFLGWSAVLVILGRDRSHRVLSTEFLIFLGAIGVLVAAALLQLATGKTRLPPVTAQWAFFVLSACATAWAGYRLNGDAARSRTVDWWSWCWLAGCGLSFLAGMSQYLQLPVSWYIVAPPYDWGRIGANIRQPNHLSTLVLMGLPCVLWLLTRRRIGFAWALLFAAVLALTVVLTGSRSGLVSLALLVALVVASTMDRPAKSIAVWAAAVAAVSFIVLVALDIYQVLPYFGASRIPGLAAYSYSDVDGGRLSLWRNAFAIAAQNPWTGAGVGQFEFYLLLSDLPVPVKMLFTNAHNLALQLAVEFGFPVTALVLGAFAWSLWRVRAVFRGGIGQFAGLSLVPVAVHSVFEFPLWYAYLLLPAAFLVGLVFGEAQPRVLVATISKRAITPLRAAGLAMAGLIIASLPHYLALAAIYAPGGHRDTAVERMETVDHAYIYGHWVAFTMLDSVPLTRISAEPRLLRLYEHYARFYMNDRFMARYALALAEQGRLEEARRLVFAIRRLEPTELDRLLQYSREAATPGALALARVIQDPAPPRISAAEFQ